MGARGLPQAEVAAPSHTQATVPGGANLHHQFLYDAHGSTRALTDAAGLIANVGGLQAFTYDAYGNLIGTAVTGGAIPTALTSLLYSGELTDAATGLQYLRARYYDPASGRFNRLDPFAGNNQDPLSLHKYLYVHANPVMGLDPSGSFSVRSAANELGVALRYVKSIVSDTASSAIFASSLPGVFINAGIGYFFGTPDHQREQTYSGFWVIGRYTRTGGSGDSFSTILGGHTDIYYNGIEIYVGQGGKSIGKPDLRDDAVWADVIYARKLDRSYTGTIQCSTSTFDGMQLAPLSDKQIVASISQVKNPILNTSLITNNCQTDVVLVTQAHGLNASGPYTAPAPAALGFAWGFVYGAFGPNYASAFEYFIGR